MKVKYVVIVCAALILVPLTVAHVLLRASLPKLDGEVHHMGVVAAVTIERDALGVPTIEAANRVDLAYGLGFVHGQDRFFEMDLSRRLAAGELSEMFGARALEQDRKARLFRFRQVARQALQHAAPEERAILEAYARGVNAGLNSLHSRPWEYWLFRSVPVEWRPEDTMLVSHAMWWDLQYGGIDREILRQEINAHMRGPDCENGWKCSLKFLYPLGTEWDAPDSPVGEINAGPGPARVDSAAARGQVAGADGATANADGAVAGAEGAVAGGHGAVAGADGSVAGADGSVAGAAGQAPQVVIPPPDILDVRGATAGPSANAPPVALVPGGGDPGRGIGSNNWAVAGRLTATGSALIANDMHLRARVPPVWYRARMRVKATDTQPAIDLNGVTLPGAPVLVAGSNGHIAWGFTNSYGNWFHVERSPCSAGNAVAHERIQVHGQPAVDFPVTMGPAGVLYRTGPDKQSCWFVSWLVQQPGATNMGLIALEGAPTVARALEIAPNLGIPHQNFVVGDREGHIAWTIAGRIPAETGPSRGLGTPRWIAPEAHPRIVDPEIGRIWTANARVTNDPAQQAAIAGVDAPVGADYDLAARAHQIRDDLLAIKGPATPADMLRIQLDDRAEFLTRWRGLLLQLLDAEAVANHPQRARFRQLLASWNARASVDSVGYRLVRTYHEQTEKSVWEMVLGALNLQTMQPVWAPSQFEAALWQLVNERPLHMLAANYSDWRQFLLAEVDATLSELRQSCPQLEHCTWGLHEPVHIQHPLSRALPFLAPLLDMPLVLLPGDHDMPRVQDGPIGASERFAVSPGHEDQGYIHIPGGQSGHPLSPYYRAGFMDWARGVAAPFLPGVAQHRLTLESD